MAARPSFNEQLAVRMTRIIGTMPMFYALVGWYALWIGINIILGVHAFDKPWSFPILLFISNFLQLIWLPALSVGQNVLGRASVQQAQQQYAMIEQIDTLTQELHTMMTAQRDTITALVHLNQAVQAALQALTTKTDEIDAEVDTLILRKEQTDGT
jgi:uncharacterized membrane protein